MNPAEQNMSSVDTEKQAAATGDHDVGVIDTRLQPVESRFDNVENPLTAIEARMEYLATKADLEKIYTLIEKTNTQIQSANNATLNQIQSANNATLNLIHRSNNTMLKWAIGILLTAIGLACTATFSVLRLSG